jgi:hypothetical protein
MLERFLVGLGDRLGFAALLALSLVGCGSGDEEHADYRYGAAEVEQLVIGTWTGTWTEAGSSARLVLEVSRQPTRRTACDSRSLGEGNQLGPQSSVRCVSSSEMLLAGNLSVEGMFADLPLTGGLWVPGAELNSARLSLSGNDRALRAEWNAGGWQACSVQRPNGALLAECTLERAP